ncbi:hypothetical protein N7481_007549 [Penicillium waksmanii]|uniref:uncharacterized protein n=1 Tax=Penicillium waksmanii TaxID=69791 RepID=UPI0025494665|nr:uncharacterized protein N7481_007549 [Penicillium waksmanii]KAJ5980251.1 hypothetical protein N7481_007549 [Penicillium waksmanii]
MGSFPCVINPGNSEDVPFDSPSRSVRSLETASVTTASTPDDIKTPDSAGLSGFHFHIDHDNAVAGPEGPHLFRMSSGSFDIKSSVEIDLIYDELPDSATTPLYSSASKLGPERRDTPVPSVPNVRTPLQSVPEVDGPLEPEQNEVLRWTPQDVVSWMQKLNFDEGIIEKFFINDINGSVLLDLQAEDLKELDIQSFGKRHGLMASIRALRNSVHGSLTESQPSIPSEPVSREPTPHSTAADVGPRSCNSTPVTGEDSSPIKEAFEEHRRRRQRVIRPNDSVSIVGIEQVFPKMHRCRKGEDCRRWQKQYARMSQLSRDLPIESVGGPVVVAGDPGNAATARNMTNPPKSDVTPSIVASSDALGPNQSTELPLSEEKLHSVEPRDPQENVRNFLNFQRLSRLQPVTDPSTPPTETFPSPEADSPGTLAENLRTLPRLHIPSTHLSSKSSAFSPIHSGQRTITPGMVRGKMAPFQSSNLQYSAGTQNDLFSPSDYYRQDPHYGQSSPSSEMDVDVPLTAIPVGPIERIFSQSVPPDMRFGNQAQQMAEPITRPVSTKVDNHRRKLSINTPQNGTPLTRLNEDRVMSPIDTPEDLEHTPRAAPCRQNPFSPSGEFSNNVIRSGWLKKRKTRMLKHEWNDQHYALRGTKFGMFADEESARRDSKALEYVDVDDYAVACSSLASDSKLTAAFKRTVLKRKDDTRGGTAFAFSLIPSPKGNGSERKFIFEKGVKSHHFAVDSAPERIELVRDLMLAKALRRGRESGATLNLNGNAI